MEVSDNNTLIREIESNNIIETIFNDDTTLSVRGRMLRSVVCLVKSIKEDGRTHPMVVTSLIVNTYSFIRLITNLQELDIIPKDYVIVRGLRIDGINSAMEFNNHKKAIFIGTPWMVTGTDAPNTDGLIADYDMGSEITGSQWIGRGQRPVDEKELIVYIPTNPDTTEISTLLRVANKYINDENVHIEATETNIDENDIEEVFGSIQIRNVTTQIDRDINANPSLKVYWDKVYNDLTSDVIGRTGEYLQRVYLSFEESREFVRNLNLKSLKEYQAWSSSGNRPNNIPSSPCDVYDNVWISWWDYLGVSEGWNGYMDYNELVEYIKPFKIKTQLEWKKYWELNEKPYNVPGYPQNTYKEWVSWYKFLGTKEKVPYVSYDDAEKFARVLKLKKLKEWMKWSKTNRPDGIPSNPQTVYKDKGWVSWGVFLGTGVIADINKVFLPFVEAKNYIHRLKLKNAKEWREYSINKRPTSIPSNPKEYYSKTNEWISWMDWLGNDTINNKDKHSDEFLNKIKTLLRDGVTQREINKKYGIGRSRLNKLNKELKLS